MTQILELRDEEEKRVLHADTTRIGRLRPHVRNVVESEAFQSLVALLLFTNFALNIIEVETKYIYIYLSIYRLKPSVCVCVCVRVCVCACVRVCVCKHIG